MIVLAPTGLQDAQGPKTYMDAILGVHRTYNNLVMTAFESEQGFKKAMEKVGARASCFGRICGIRHAFGL